MCFVCAPSQQSPIDIRDAYQTDFGPRGLKIGYTSKLKGKIAPKKEEKDKFYVKYEDVDNQDIKLAGQLFHVVEMHFHYYSEHWIDTKQFAMEAHIVNQNTVTGNRAVLGVMIEESSKARSSTSSKNLVHLDSKNKTNDGKPDHLIETNAKYWLPNNKESYYRYEGSLTTPEFDENVSWLVFSEPLVLSKKEIAVLRQWFGLSVRLPQPINRRYILSNVKKRA